MARSVSASSSSSSSAKSKAPKAAPSSKSRLTAATKKGAGSKAAPGAALPPTVLIAPAGEDRRQVDLVARISERFDASLRDRLEKEIAAYAGPPIELSTSLDTFFHEASALACLAEWHSVPRGVIHESLAPHAERLGGDIAAQLLFLAKLGAEGEILVEQGRAPTGDAIIQRGIAVFRRLRIALAVLVDDGVEDQKDVAVAALRRQYVGTPTTTKKLASGLSAYAGVCRTLESELSALPGFEMNLIQEATSIAGIIVSRTSAPRTTAGTSGLTTRRNAIVALIRARMQKLRLVMRYTFADHPSIIKSLASAHVRERRRASKGKEPKPDGLPAPKPQKPAPVDDTNDEDDRIPDDLIDDDE